MTTSYPEDMSQVEIDYTRHPRGFAFVNITDRSGAHRRFADGTTVMIVSKGRGGMWTAQCMSRDALIGSIVASVGNSDAAANIGGITASGATRHAAVAALVETLRQSQAAAN